MKASDIRFRCSGLGKIVSGEREGKELSKTVKTNLIDIYTSAVYGRREEINSKFLEKGNKREEDAITMLSLFNKRFYKKNDIRLTNDYITGECDLFIGESIEKAEETHDIKCSWSLHTFNRSKFGELNSDYKWQGVGYMWLTGAEKHTVNYCLVNGTADAINDEKRRLAYRLGCIDADIEPPTYVEKCKQIEINHIFDLQAFMMENPYFQFHTPPSEWSFDIPINKRIHQFVVERDESEIESLRLRIIKVMDWMQNNLFNK